MSKPDHFTCPGGEEVPIGKPCPVCGAAPSGEACGRAWRETERYQEALKTIAGFGNVNLAGEWEPALRDIIRSMTDCAKRALRETV